MSISLNKHFQPTSDHIPCACKPFESDIMQALLFRFRIHRLLNYFPNRLLPMCTHKKRLRAKIPEAEKWRSAQSTVDKVATPNHHLTTAPAKIQFYLLLLLNSCSQIYTPFWVSWWHSLWKQVTGNWYQPITKNSKSALAIQRRDQHFFTPFQFHTK